MRTTAQLTYEKVRFDEPKDAHLVVTLTAPGAGARAARPPVCVIPVLDVSGSMQGQKLHYAKQSILKLVDHLAPGDFCGVVTFSTEVATIAAPEAMTPERKAALQAAVGRLRPEQNTNLAGGMLGGLDHARVAKLPDSMRARVILFTDGLANEGPAKTPEELCDLLRANLGDATLSAFGYGADADQDLLRELATLGKGNYAYVASPEDALTAFARELGGLLSTHAQAIELAVTPQPGVAITDVVSDVDANEVNGTVVIRIPDLLADEVRHVVLGVRLEARPVALDAPACVAEVAVRYERLEGGRIVRTDEACRATVRFVPAAEAQPAPARALDEVVALAQLVRVQIEAEELARRGDYDRAGGVMRLYQTAAATRGHAAAAATAGKLADAMSDGDAYRRKAAYRSSVRKGATRSVASAFEAEADADLRSLGQAKRTSAQRQMEASFGAGGATPSGARRTQRERSSKSVTRRRSKRW